MMRELNARYEKRYLIVAPVTFCWPCQKGIVHSGRGFTRDISNRGVLVEAGNCPPKGARVQLAITLPKVNGDRHGLVLQAEGFVVRVECEGASEACHGSLIFAASIHFYPEQRTALERISMGKAAVSAKPYIV